MAEAVTSQAGSIGTAVTSAAESHGLAQYVPMLSNTAATLQELATR